MGLVVCGAKCWGGPIDVLAAGGDRAFFHMDLIVSSNCLPVYSNGFVSKHFSITGNKRSGKFQNGFSYLMLIT